MIGTCEWEEFLGFLESLGVGLEYHCVWEEQILTETELEDIYFHLEWGQSSAQTARIQDVIPC